MPITIQEIIASDTISQFADKVNFNFDQLLLNGGGPAGPIGPAGPTGPAGGRGPKGTTWYTGLVAPTSIIVSPNLRTGDFYLQDSQQLPPLSTDGDVWEYNGTTWVLTTTNLQGPQGLVGQTGGFSEFFGIAPNLFSNKNTVYPAPTGGGGLGADANNEGILTVMIGAGYQNTDTSGSGIALSSEYLLTNNMAQSLQSPNTTLFLHQKNSQARAIVLHGGQNAGNTEKYEQNAVGLLSGISLQPDDMVRIDIPKGPTTPSNNNDTLGFQVYSPLRGHEFFAGTQIRLTSGMSGSSPGFAGYNANIELTVGTGGVAAGNKYMLSTQGTAATGLMELGNFSPTISVPPLDVNANARFQLISGNQLFVGGESADIKFITGQTFSVDTVSGGQSGAAIKLNSGNGGIDIISNDGEIKIQQDDSGSVRDITILNSANPGSTPGGDIYIMNQSQIILRRNAVAAQGAPSIVIDNEGAQYPSSDRHTRFVGHQTWRAAGVGAGIVPPASNIFRYFDVGAAGVLGSGSILSKYGNTFNQIPAGFSYALWMAARDASGIRNTGVKIGRSSYGDERSLSISIQDVYPMVGADLQYSYIGDSLYGGAMFATPKVNNRTLKIGQNLSVTPTNEVIGYDNYIDVYHPTAGGWNNDKGGNYGYDYACSAGMGTGTFFSGNAANILAHSYVSLTAAPAIGQGQVSIGAGAGACTNQLNQAANYSKNINQDIRFPEMAGTTPPGAEIMCQFTMLGASYRNQTTMGGATWTKDYYGQINIQIPTFRIKKYNAANWEAWQYKTITVNVLQGNNSQQTPQFWWNRWRGKLIWDGSVDTWMTGTRACSSAITGGNNVYTDIQYGWNICGSSQPMGAILVTGACIN